MFRPKLLDTIHHYPKGQLLKDLAAGVVVGIVALPLAIAFAIASGVSPEKGLITAIVAGFLISVLGGSRVQIGGPTGAFIVIVYGIVMEYGVNGLVVATFLAGIMLVLMGIARFGSVIKVIPHPLIIGFTTGIAVIIFSAQLKDVLGLPVENVPAAFIDKWQMVIAHITEINYWALAVTTGTVLTILLFRRISGVIPGSLVAILIFTIIVVVFRLPVETIGSRFGHLPTSFQSPQVPALSWELVGTMIRPAITIALLAGIESLLSAVVADGMIGGNHRSNMELVAQGIANIGSALFGGIPATGAIARTVTNIKNGGRTPVAGIVHAITLLLIMLLAAQLIVFIPMSCLAGILVVVAYNMSELETFFQIAKGNRSDAIVLITTCLLTIFFDLTLALEVGMILAVFLFFRKMMQISGVSNMLSEKEEETSDITRYSIPSDVQVFELSGPLFFGAAYKFKDSIKSLRIKPAKIIVRMKNVPVIDATGIQTLQDVLKMCEHDKIKLILTEVPPEVFSELKRSRLVFRIGKRFVTPDLDTAINVSRAA